MKNEEEGKEFSRSSLILQSARFIMGEEEHRPREASGVLETEVERRVGRFLLLNSSMVLFYNGDHDALHN